MSIDFPERLPHDEGIAQEAGFKTAHVLEAEGVLFTEAYTLGERAGEIGATFTILALRQMGILGTIDPVGFNTALRQIEEESGVRETLEALWDSRSLESDAAKIETVDDRERGLPERVRDIDY